jgi:aspartyl-tRNA(Asn)/glutamyl-tRNA(Gln) amidotransferase subunit A
MYLTDIMTVGANITGHPAISVPVGEDNGLPVGMQIIAPQKADRQLLLAAKVFEGLK